MPEGWVRAGYKKKNKCEKCGRKLNHPDAGVIHHVNGNTNDNHFFNLRTICLVCEVDVKYGFVGINPDDLTPDF